MALSPGSPRAPSGLSPGSAFLQRPYLCFRPPGPRGMSPRADRGATELELSFSQTGFPGAHTQPGLLLAGSPPTPVHANEGQPAGKRDSLSRPLNKKELQGFLALPKGASTWPLRAVPGGRVSQGPAARRGLRAFPFTPGWWVQEVGRRGRGMKALWGAEAKG